MRAKSEMLKGPLANETDEACRYSRYNYEEKYRERLAEEDIGALARLSNDRAHLRAGNGPTAATLSALDSQWRGVCRSVKTLVGEAGICAYKSYSPAKILPRDAVSYCAPAGPISVNFGPGSTDSSPIYRIDARFRAKSNPPRTCTDGHFGPLSSCLLFYARCWRQRDVLCVTEARRTLRVALFSILACNE